MTEHSYIGKFVSDKLPLVDSLAEVIPVWKHLILHTAKFFGVLSTIPNLSFKKSVVFCLSSATFVTATVVSLDKIFELIKFLFDIEAPYPPLNILGEIFLELIAFVWFFVTGVVFTISNFVYAKIFRSKTPFSRLLIGSFYMNTFLQTTSTIFLIALLIIVSFSTFDVTYLRIGDARIPFGDPKIHDSFALSAWIVVYSIWIILIAPTFSYISAARMTSISVKRLVISSMLAPFVVIALLVFLSFIVHLGISFFSASG